MNIDQQTLDHIRQKYNLQLILLHGSQLTQKTHGESDTDIAVIRNDQSEPLDTLDVIADLCEAFHTDSIDLSDLTTTDPLHLFAAVSKSELLSGKNRDYQQLQLTAFHKYQDFQPYLKMEAEMVQQKLQLYVTS